MSAGAIGWDFDGTLGFRAGGQSAWSQLLVETLDAHEPGHDGNLQGMRELLRDGFPWHRHETPHPELCEAEAWWTHVEGVLADALGSTGLAPERAGALARHVHERYVDPATWRLYDDAIPVLEQLAADGWRHVIVSNHVPELEQIVGSLGLASLVDRVICSAHTGYEKPHPQAFARLVDACGDTTPIWMIGDSYAADVAGAEAACIPAILVRRPHPGAQRYAKDLSGVPPLLT